MRSFVLLSCVVGFAVVLLGACAAVQHPTRSICKDSCLKVEERAQAECLAKCE
jgi:hypothetical protein